MFFDTHAHYDDECFDEDRDRLLSQLPAAGVKLLMNPGCSIDSSRAAITFAEKYPFVYAAVGIHPENADSLNDITFALLTEMASHPRVKAIGEIGLDYHYETSSRQQQQIALTQQLCLAQQLNMPVILHEREACEDCLKILNQFPNVQGVYHCFSGSWETAKIILDRGWYLSFTGVVTFKNARKAPKIISNMPLDRLMLETDSPYMAPVPVRGTRNDSRNLKYIAEEIGKIRNISAEEVARITSENGRRFFNISD